MSFKLPDLPYDYNALEPYIDTETMHLHHDAHHANYVAKLNAALGITAPNTPSLTDIIATAGKSTVAIRNNAGGHYNHSLFWKSMTPVGTTNPKPTGSLKEAIDGKWGSVEEMQRVFNDAAANRFGSGWAWLGVDGGGELQIVSTGNMDNPLMKGVCEVDMVPVLVLDVWEHAYYLKYQNRRPEYIQRWWSVVNWDQAAEHYDLYASKGVPVPIA